jgi:hypothetical protein
MGLPEGPQIRGILRRHALPKPRSLSLHPRAGFPPHTFCHPPSFPPSTPGPKDPKA